MSRTQTVYVTREIPSDGIEILEEAADVRRGDDSPPPKAEIKRALSEFSAEGLLCMLPDVIDEDILDASPNLAVVSTLSVGYDHIDVEAAAERGIDIGHTPGVLSETCADLAWSLLTTAARRIVEAHHYIRDGEWDTWGPNVLTGQDIHGATLGIIGLGKIGTAVARRSAGFDMDVRYTARSRKPDREAELAEYGIDAEHVDLDDLLSDSDFVSVNVPLTDKTDGLLGERELRLMDEDAILVNTARGEVVETDALLTALENDWIARAALDVTNPEPLPPDHPLTAYAPEKLIVSPHIGSASVPTRNRMARMAARNVVAGLAGEPLPNAVV